MASEKKKTSDKKTDKKVSKTAAPKVAKSAKKVSLGEGASGDFVVVVPQGQQALCEFHLTPAKPTASAPGNWLFVPAAGGTDIDNLEVDFSASSTPLERQFERAVLVVTMAQAPGSNGTWRFALGGVATDVADADPDNDVTVELVDNGLTLVAYIQAFDSTEEEIGFRFVASFTNNTTGAVSIYESKDPMVRISRPR